MESASLTAVVAAVLFALALTVPVGGGILPVSVPVAARLDGRRGGGGGGMLLLTMRLRAVFFDFEGEEADDDDDRCLQMHMVVSQRQM